MTCDTTYRVISLAGLAATVGGSVLHYLAAGRKVRAGGPAGGPADVRRLGFLERIVFLGFALTLLCLAATGMWANLLLGQRLAGWGLMLHVAAGGAFMACLLLLAVLWAEDCRFRELDAHWRRACREHPDRPAPAGRFDPGQKCAFWLALALAVVAALSMFVSMLPIFTPEGLELLRDVHRYSGLLLLIVAYVHFYRTVIVRRGKIAWLLRGKVSSDWARHYHGLWRPAGQGEPDA